MAGLIDFLSAGVFTDKFHVDEQSIRWQNGIVAKLHASTGALLGLFTCLVFAKELLGDHIRCFRNYDGTDSNIDQDAFNSYCYITTTFTIPKHTGKGSDGNAPYHGIGPHTPGDEVIYHSYYQWVPYLLFLQAISFYVPHLFYKFSQDGKVQQLLNNLQNVIQYNEDRADKVGDVHLYLQDYYGTWFWWSFKLVASDFLNLINVIANIFLVHWYLGFNFLSYGPQVLSYLTSDEQTRGPDPFHTIFPKMTKCSLNTFGPSGTIQTLDSLCVLPINVLNERIYFILWIWFTILTVITIMEDISWLFFIAFRTYRVNFLARFAASSYNDPHGDRIPNVRKKLRKILEKCSFGDWLMIYLIARNLDRRTFTEVANTIFEPKKGYYPDEEESLPHNNKDNESLYKGSDY